MAGDLTCYLPPSAGAPWLYSPTCSLAHNFSQENVSRGVTSSEPLEWRLLSSGTNPMSLILCQQREVANIDSR